MTDTATPRTEQLASGVHAYIQSDGGWFVNNSGIIVGSDTVTVIDSAATAARTAGLRAAIARVSPLPVATLVNTHWHTDHTNGNYQFRGATIVAHEQTRAMMLEHAPTKPDPGGPFPDVEWGPLEPAPPFLTYAEGITLWAGETRCDISWVGTPAHTTDDSVVWIEEHSILFAGDLAFNGSAPLMSAGSVAGAIEVLTELRQLGARHVVPGHGDVCGPEVFDTEIEYLRFVQDLAATGHRLGRTPLEAARDAADNPFAHLLDSERLVANLHRAYAELDGAAPGEPIDLTATRRDMVALHGGPLRCLA
ncbi:MBL fold metallo-hydrolase [Amycolatopsis bartoniae]|uniref:MBL fold metallo-hydrolase n=1 Tax=Amycolatopsis bartoniae TaxID=941986 RepID=A0A8H9IQY4_9PSEU|nr:MBL fold metallo-hydrolase [Amycolatopsis bartoniae]TVT10173.1 MBL fold metallo-hydrolase [Amycolatopsis bartoniae]GHF35153.1 MBL fold metallo-hydrolase [Amycolatopsis bartoniae]